jgi:dihydrofolate synthase / folylpolyglutamate synthase
MDESSEIARRLFSRTTHGIKLGLERMRAAAARSGNPQESYASVHVAGTNGKGSTCAYIEAVLRSQGYRTGLFTSPHIVSFEERFCINGTPVSSAAWVEVYRGLESTIEDLGLTFFEASALIAFELFKREKVDFAVFETGMGGRLDATNIIVPRACAITRIAMDHMNFLGNDLVSIAGEKLGIVKSNVACIMAEPETPGVRTAALDVCREKQAPCVFVDYTKETMDIETAGRGVSFTYDGRRFELPLAGSHQVQNALVAIHTLRALGINDLQKISAAMGATFLPGRFHRERVGGKTIVFDVGHNPDAARSFVETCSRCFGDSPVTLVAGIMKDKDMAGMFDHYCRRAGNLVLTRPAGERSAETSTLRANIPLWYKGSVLETGAVAEAVKAGLASSDPITAVVGSFFTVGEAMVSLGISPYPGH